MSLKETLDKTTDYKKKYDFYTKLGYSEKAACILSCLEYGERFISKFAKDLGDEDILNKIYDYFDDDNIETVIERIEKKYSPKPLYERSGPSMILASKQSSKPLGIRMSKNIMLKEDVAADGAITPIEGGFSEMPLELKENLSTDSYEQIEEKDAKGVFTAPTSTFRMTTTTASMGVVMNQIRNGRHIDLSQIRIEEVLNYFDFNTSKPTEDIFSISTEILDKNTDKKILYINAQAKSEVKEHQNIILLLDASGSMMSNNEVTQQAIAVIVSKLKIGDIFSLVTYSSDDETVLKNYAIRSELDKEYIMGKLMTIKIDGYTHGSKGIETAYEIGRKNYDKEWNNQVILITDGDLNFGITDKGGLEKLIEEKKKENLFLSVIGTGLWNYQDDKLEVLAKHGNGTYCVINDLEDVAESIDKRYESLTNIVAKDVKAQVEFNPRFVKAYRLLGYENRELNHEDFLNDKVISEPYGSGGHGVALYELTMGDASESGSNLKYQTPVVNDSDELCTVKIRFKEPLADESHEIEQAVKMETRDNKNVRLAYLLYCISEKLRGSDKLDEDDEKFLQKTIEEKSYQEFAELNGERLESFINSYQKTKQ